MKPILYSLILMILCSCTGNKDTTRIQNLRCEYIVNPIGIDTESPRFTWQIVSDGQGVEQSAYKIFLGTDSSSVASGKGDVWESVRTESSTIPAIYSGPSLKPFTRYYWCLKIKQRNGGWTALSESAAFETGYMNKAPWTGQWITDTYDYNLKPAPYFRKEITLSKKIRAARAYIAVAGLYELYLNGEKAGDHRLDPMYTRFDRRTLYITYDVTDKLRSGENVIGVLLGNGWYNHQSTAVWYFDKAPWRARPKFCMDLRIQYDDGTEEITGTGQDWKTSLSPVVFNSIYTAEHYDARLEQPGWDEPGFDDSKWENSLNTGAPSTNITAQILHPVRNVEKITASTMVQFSNKNYVFDFGRNISGVISIKVSGEEGTEVRLIHAEKLDNKGHSDLSNIDVHYRPTDDSDPFQTDILTLSGKKEDEFMPRFNYKGFQYVEIVSDKPVNITKESMTAYFMHSDVPPAGKINSSNNTLNRAWAASNASYLSNLFGYPTDCPQREKNGWTGDAQINIETGLYNFDGITIYEKWLADHRDEQLPNGILPAIIPTSGWGYHWANGPDWTSTIAIIPWNIWLFYGDSRLLESCYDNIRLYVDHIDGKYPSGLTDWGLGDWVPVKSVTPKEFTSTAYYFADVTILSKAAQLFGKPEDKEKYTRLAEKIKKAFNDKYLDTATAVYGKGLQTELSAALHWGLVPEEYIPAVAENLAARVIADKEHIDVGLLGTKTILNALSENGHGDLAYRVAAQESYPSWGWWIVNGATTFYENWPLDAAHDISMNHIMFGEINAWYYKALGGIFPDEKAPGFKNVILKPNFVEGLDHFEAEHEGPYGTIVSKWEKSSDKVTYKVSIPANSTATLFLKADRIMTGGEDIMNTRSVKTVKEGDRVFKILLKSGEYDFEVFAQSQKTDK
jgi:alpha-L-rhamnosidase